MDKVSMSYLFSFSRYQTKCVIEFLLRQLMTPWTLRFIFDHPPKQWLTGRKRGKDRNTKKSFLDEIKSIFHSFWRTIICWKNKKLMKIADTSFKQNKEYMWNYALWSQTKKQVKMVAKHLSFTWIHNADRASSRILGQFPILTKRGTWNFITPCSKVLQPKNVLFMFH